MYCISCGGENPDYGKFCHNCGAKLVRHGNVAQPRQVAPPIPTEEQLLIRILKTDPKPNQCHKCGATTDLTRWPFAMGRVVSVKREWGETLARLGVSAVSIATVPLTGFGGFSWKSPNKTTSYRVIKAELVLCTSCVAWASINRKQTELKDEAYRLHPWAEQLQRIGYDKFLSAGELARLQPTKKSGG